MTLLYSLYSRWQALIVTNLHRLGICIGVSKRSVKTAYAASERRHLIKLSFMLPRLCSSRRYSAHGHAPLNSKITAARRWTWRTRCLGGLVDKILFNFSSLWVKTIPLLFSGSGRWTDRSCHTFFQTAPIWGQALSYGRRTVWRWPRIANGMPARVHSRPRLNHNLPPIISNKWGANYVWQ